MNVFGWELSLARKSSTVTLNELIQRLETAHGTLSGVAVTPDTAMESPTVHAVVTAVSRRIATLPVHVLRKTVTGGRTSKEALPRHPVERLLNRPNEWQSRVSYWLDATSWLVRYGNFYAFKGRGTTGPVRRLEPLLPGAVDPVQDDNLAVRYRVARSSGSLEEYDPSQIHHVRGPARNGLKGDSPIMDVREAIALEIAAERFGASFFGNGAMPLMVFKYAAGFQHESNEQRQAFVEGFQRAYSGKSRLRALLLPSGIEAGDPIALDNDKAQFLETRKMQRAVIAGALGVPARFVGDLENAHFNNVEQQSLDFVQTVIQPYCQMFESAMERDLLTDEDRRDGVIIRFNLDGALRGDFKTRQEGLKIMREAGVISANEWREQLGWNPLADDQRGDDVWQQGPSGQSGPAPGDSQEDDDGLDS